MIYMDECAQSIRRYRHPIYRHKAHKYMRQILTELKRKYVINTCKFSIYILGVQVAINLTPRKES
jgi:hypothetical protein